MAVQRKARPTDTQETGSLAAGVFAALPDLLLCGLFLYTWVRPMAIDPLMVKRLTALTLLEFIVMHSAPFSGIVALSEMKRHLKVLALAGLGAFYMLFAWGFALAFGSNWPLYSFFGLMLNRLLGVLVGAVPRGAQAMYLGSCWIVGALAYLGAIFFTAFAPVPRLGISREVVAAQHFTTGGIWPEEPYRALAFGAIYFGIVAMWEVVGRGRMVERAARQQRRGR